MSTVILVIHLLIAIALIVTVLLQPSEGGGLGIGGGGGGGGGGMSGFLTGRGTANLLTRTTAVLAAAFMATSIFLTILAGGRSEPGSILDTVPGSQAPATQAPAGEQPSAPASGEQDGGPEVPIE